MGAVGTPTPQIRGLVIRLSSIIDRHLCHRYRPWVQERLKLPRSVISPRLHKRLSIRIVNRHPVYSIPADHNSPILRSCLN